MVNGYLDGLSFRSEDLARLIIEQVQVGTMIGADEEENNKDQNVFALLTVLSAGVHSTQPVMKEALTYVLDKSR